MFAVIPGARGIVVGGGRHRVAGEGQRYRVFVPPSLRSSESLRAGSGISNINVAAKSRPFGINGL